MYTRSGDTWTFKQRIEETTTTRHTNFGSSVAISNDLALIGADARDEERETDGTVFAFVRSGGTTFEPGTYWLQPWQPIPPDVPPEAQGRYGFGHYGADIAVSDSTLVIGSPTRFIDNKPLLEKGLVSVYEIPPR